MPDERLRIGGQSAAAIRLNLLRPAIEPILRSHGVPADLAAVILVESGGRATALSPKGARGLWQLMPDTARRYGLRVDETQDDRLNQFKATHAAAGYLHDLYAQFGDWKLALAAYNTGEANVGSAILRARTQDFDQLTNRRMLPLETIRYVPLVLAAAATIGQPSALGERHSTASAATVFAVSAP
jgi:membrane-bound lytic murein transglycosylase D